MVQILSVLIIKLYSNSFLVEYVQQMARHLPDQFVTQFRWNCSSTLNRYVCYYSVKARIDKICWTPGVPRSSNGIVCYFESEGDPLLLFLILSATTFVLFMHNIMPIFFNCIPISAAISQAKEIHSYYSSFFLQPLSFCSCTIYCQYLLIAFQYQLLLYKALVRKALPRHQKICIFVFETTYLQDVSKRKRNGDFNNLFLP